MKGCRNGVGIVFNTKLTLSCATREGARFYPNLACFTEILYPLVLS